MITPDRPLLPHLQSCRGVVDALRASAAGDRGLTYVQSARSEERVTYAQLLGRARAVLGRLQADGVRPGDHLVLVTDDLALFTATFWACALGGVVVVPIAVPANEAGHQKLASVLATLGRPWLATDQPDAVAGRQPDELLPRGRRLQLDRTAFEAPGGVEDGGERQLDDVVLIQFSSGSTGRPKGVQVTARNLLANASGIVERCGIDAGADRLLNWMPLTHDFGIVYFHVLPTVFGVEHALIATQAFMRHPTLWMQKASDLASTITAGPNYAYHHFLKRFKPGAHPDWQLQSLRMIVNGAEPISCDLSRRFFEALATHGLSPLAATPGYGLAESTLMITHGDPRQPFGSRVLDRRRLSLGDAVRTVPADHPDALEFATAGSPARNVELRITGADRQPLPDGHVGTVETRSACVTPGYFGQEAATRAVIDPQGWLDTGDVGFISDGELYITGRRKDLVIINGVNYYPHDIEEVAARVPPLDLNAVAACSVRMPGEDREGLVLFIRAREEGEAFLDLADRLRDHVLAQMGLPVDHCLAIRQIPKTTSGKVQRFLLAQRFAEGEFDDQIAQVRARRSAGRLRQAWDSRDRHALEAALAQEAARIAPRADWTDARTLATPLMELGLGSLHLVEFITRINDSLGQRLPVSWMFEHPSVAALVSPLLALHGGAEVSLAPVADVGHPSPAVPSGASREVAIIGMACRFPGGADDPDAYWSLLRSGTDATGPFPSDRWDPALNATARTDRGAYLQGLDRFDHRFFRLTPVEAERLDPQQRLLLTVSWEAFEHAGVDPLSLKGSATGVFTAIAASDYAQAEARSGRLEAIGPYAFTGTAASVASGRLSFFYGLEGPNVAVDTACSSALAAVHLAVQSLRNGECELALASAVNLILSPDMQVGLSRLNALSPDGRCKAFDASADGYARGEGCAGVVLKRLEDALRDGDPVLAVIRGTAMNHDGASNGLTAPNGGAQHRVIRAAQRDARIEPGAVGYVEAHGTGTALGDPVEVMALAQAYGQDRSPEDRPLLIGSVKTNVAHLETAAGMASLLKVVLALQHREVPATLHLREPNPMIPWSDVAVRVVDTARPWPSGADETPALAGISAFGMSGTNVHLIVATAPEPAITDTLHAGGAEASIGSQHEQTPVLLSARTEDDLRAMAARYGRWLHAQPQRLPDLGRTVARHRTRWPHRVAVVGGDAHEVAKQLLALADAGRPQPPSASGWVCVFPGQGSQCPEAIWSLATREPVFRHRLEHFDAILRPWLPRSLLDLMIDGSAQDLARTEHTQVVTVACGLALFDLWQSWGLRPAAVVGHSVGEIAAAAACGAIAPENAVIFAARRGALMRDLSTGAMLAVACTLTRVGELLDLGARRVEIAAVNGTASITLAGTVEAIEAVEPILAAHGVRTSRLQVSHAFHSVSMEPALDAVARLADDLLRPAAARTRFVSSLLGSAVDLADWSPADYWRRHAREPVRFHDALAAADAPGTAFIELGARPVFPALAASERPHAEWLVCSDARGQMLGATLRALGRAHELGLDVDMRTLFAPRGGRFARIPTYPFQGSTPMLSTVGPDAGIRSSSPAPTAAAMPPASAVPAPRAATTASTEAIGARLRRLVSNVSGIAESEVVPDANWFALGLDSLLVLQLQLAVNKAFGLDIKLSDVFERGTTLRDLSALVVEALARTAPPAADAPAAEPARPAHAAASRPPAAALPAAPGGDIETLLLRQIGALEQLFRQQLEVLNGIAPGSAPFEATPTVAPPEPAPAPAAVATSAAPPRAAGPSSPAPAPKPGPAKAEVKGLYRQVPGRDAQWSDARARHVRVLADAYLARTGGSRRLTQDGRAVYANPRAVIGFRPEWKEMTFPLHVERADGAYVWDVDGNRYVDITMGFGATLLGHNPPFVRAALIDELGRGAPLGPQTPHAVEVARLIAEMTGAERVAFFTTGSEAVMVAVRLARAVTQRNRIVIFTNAYHGTFDGFLAMGWVDDGKPQTYPLTDGTPPKMVEDVVVLRYGDPRALQTIREMGAELAAVLVEPVQSRDPTVQPREFLHELRSITQDTGTALIFDEMIMGFRVHPGGAQHHFGVAADLCTYGKVVGGGMPIGVVAGRARFLDAVDGGQWTYGDDSSPATRTAFVAGTFNNHPLSMVAAKAVLGHLQAAGAQLQAALNARTAAMAERLNQVFADEQVPIRCVHFSSLFRFEFADDCEVLNYHLLRQGVFVWEGRNCFLSTAHSDDDIEFIVDTVRAGVREMKAAGYVQPKAMAAGGAAVAASQGA